MFESNKETASTTAPFWIIESIEKTKPKIPPNAMPSNKPLFSFFGEKVSTIELESVIFIYTQTGKPKNIALPKVSSNHIGKLKKLLYKTHKIKTNINNGKNIMLEVFLVFVRDSIYNNF